MDVIKFCTSGTVVKKVSDNFVEVQIELIKMLQSFIGLADFWDKWQKLTIYNFL